MRVDHIAALAAKASRAQAVYVRQLSIAPGAQCPIARDALAAAEMAYREAIDGLSADELREMEHASLALY